MQIWGVALVLGALADLGVVALVRGALADLGVVLVWGALTDLGVEELALVHGQYTDTQRELQALNFRYCFLHFVLE